LRKELTRELKQLNKRRRRRWRISIIEMKLKIKDKSVDTERGNTNESWSIRGGVSKSLSILVT
jgi:hypothetical protein